MEQEIASLLNKNANRIKKHPYLVNGLILAELKGKYSDKEILKRLETPNTEELTQYGNYDDYYKYRTIDNRIYLLSDLLDNKSVLDIGCHYGKIAKDIYFNCTCKYYLGCDIDHHLIRKAKHKLVDFVLEQVYKLPRSVATHLSIKDKTRLLLHHKIQFEYADIMRYTIDYSFDVILCLSVIKWIHLEHLDSGLESFFRNMYALLEPDGLFVLETYDVDSYYKKLHPLNYANFLKLEYTPKDYNDLLIKEGFSFVKTIECDQSHGFQPRSLLLYKK